MRRLFRPVQYQGVATLAEHGSVEADLDGCRLGLVAEHALDGAADYHSQVALLRPTTTTAPMLVSLW